MSKAPNFNRIAGIYKWMELFSFGPWLALTRRTFIGKLGHCRRALVLGDGDGRFSAMLLRTKPALQLHAVDGSEAMLRALRGRARSNEGRLQTEMADIREWRPPAGSGAGLSLLESSARYDLVVSHFFLDCLSDREVEALAARIHGAILPGAIWVVSEFAVPSGLFGRWVARPVVAGLYLSFGFLTGLTVRSLPDHAAALRGAGFSLIERRTRLGGLLVAELWCASHPTQS
jgi:SAM-dependent methyltransferase